MKFPYKKLPLSVHSSYFGSSILKPIIPIVITHKNQEIKYDVLIDSGADFSIFDAEIGEYLKVDVKSGSEIKFGGIQEQKRATAHLHDVSVTIGGNRYKTTVGFSYDIAKYGYGILGQKGFFELFNITFVYHKEMIELKEKKITIL